MPLARINNRLLHLVHIPKTGGASITDYMRKKGKVALYSREKLAWARSTPQHLEFDVSRTLVPEGFADVSFAIMRDPLARLLSEYRYRATRHSNQNTVLGHLTAFEGMKVELDWNEEFQGTFDEWVGLVFDRCIEVPHVCDNHIRPQTDFIGPNMKIFLFERGLQKVYRWIDKITDTHEILSPLDWNESRKFDVEVRSNTKAKIRKFYESDYLVIKTLKNTPDDYQIIKNADGPSSGGISSDYEPIAKILNALEHSTPL
ncbi:sulfotransferase family 2 domain-containing protein [Roseovarius sp. Pro17]|uniref:sulfotransferase family 2 domain-containing protein n=1 Tax=Roseovarius sp. Pro17 TaxID=3108175 RepID=UPI002D786A3C|nr:sulfotransferase family 2 domain-containing protein [Roseovarius sp. Pro17]